MPETQPTAICAAGIAAVEVSLGAGRGFSYDTDHDQGAALDLTLEKGRLSFESSVMAAEKDSSDSRFLFAFACLNHGCGMEVLQALKADPVPPQLPSLC